MICLIKYLGYEYDTTSFTPLFQGLNINIVDLQANFVETEQ